MPLELFDEDAVATPAGQALLDEIEAFAGAFYRKVRQLDITPRDAAILGLHADIGLKMAQVLAYRRMKAAQQREAVADADNQENP